jgi:hypothetical protein
MRPGILGRMDLPRERSVTIRVYPAERDWLNSRQRKISAERDEWVDMADLMREFVSALRLSEEGA